MRGFYFFFLLTSLIEVPLSSANPTEAPVIAVASQLQTLDSAEGRAEMPFDISLDWNHPQPQVTRAVIVFHGKSRDADGYYRAAIWAAKRAGQDVSASSIVIAPQFLNEEDARFHHIPREVLRWRQGTWEAGTDSTGPISISSYEVIDLIVAHLADRYLFPNLEVIVIAGHSGGGQAVQRYAIVGRAEQLVANTIHLRYVVANPSSYLYFGNERPLFNGPAFTLRDASASGCTEFNHWKFGPLDIHERYVRRAGTAGWSTLEKRFAEKDVIYLLGTADVDPGEKDLDISCAAELEGPNRLLRGEAYYSWLHDRHTTIWNQQLWFVPKVAHSAGEMFRSQCGVAALFRGPSCSSQ